MSDLDAQKSSRTPWRTVKHDALPRFVPGIGIVDSFLNPVKKVWQKDKYNPTTNDGEFMAWALF